MPEGWYDAVYQPIQVGDFIIIYSLKGYGEGVFDYGQVTALAKNAYLAFCIKFNRVRAPRRMPRPSHGYPSHIDYIPIIEKSSTIKLNKVLVVPESAIDPLAVKVFRGEEIKKPTKTIADTLDTIDLI